MTSNESLILQFDNSFKILIYKMYVILYSQVYLTVKMYFSNNNVREISGRGGPPGYATDTLRLHGFRSTRRSVPPSSLIDLVTNSTRRRVRYASLCNHIRDQSFILCDSCMGISY